MIKISSKELKQFYNDPAMWPGHTYHQDEAIYLPDGSLLEDDPNYTDDIDTLPDDIMVEVEGGDVINPLGDTRLGSFESRLSEWQKKQEYATVIVEIAKDRRSELQKAIKSLGGRIL